jgi:hypothetical protein
MADRTFEEIMADEAEAKRAVTKRLAELGLPKAGEELHAFSTPRYGLPSEYRYAAVTEAQARAIDRCFRAIFPDHRVGAVDEYEIKSWTVEVFAGRGNIWLTITGGLKGDEGTAAQYFCRKRLSCRIGKRGGLWAHNGGKRLTGRKVLIHGIY